MGNWKLIANVILYHLPLERKNIVDNFGYKYKPRKALPSLWGQVISSGLAKLKAYFLLYEHI